MFIKPLKFFGIFLVFFFSLSGSAGPQKKRVKKFKKAEHCVAYKVKKRIMMISRATVFGKNCQLSIAQRFKGTQMYVELSFPVAGFRSGEKMRDESLPALLSMENSEQITFVSSEFAKKKLSEPKFELHGTLHIGKLQKDLVIEVLAQGQAWVGQVRTSFSELGLELPQIAGGTVVKVDNSLELHFQLQRNRLAYGNTF